MLTPERLAEIVQEADRARIRFGRDPNPDAPVSIGASELLELAAGFGAGLAGLDTLLEGAAVLSIQPGDLLAVRVDAESGADFRALQAALSSLAVSFQCRVVAMPLGATLEQVDGSTLDAFGAAVRLRLDPSRKGTGDLATRARIVAEAASEMGLVVVKPQRVTS